MSDGEIKAQVAKFKDSLKKLNTTTDVAMAFKELKANNAPLWMLHMVSLRYKEVNPYNV